MVKVSASILSGDFSKLSEEAKMLEECGADMIHMDVMDGVFVPQITFGAKMVSALRRHTSLTMDVHLMIENPQKHIKDFAAAGSDIITFHIEAVDDAESVLDEIKSYGIKAGISIKPKTKMDTILHLLDRCDMVLIMTVEPGYGGQTMIADTVEKIRKLRDVAPDIDIQVDGGINDKTIKTVIDAGANIIVAGSYIFNADDRQIQIEKLRG